MHFQGQVPLVTSLWTQTVLRVLGGAPALVAADPTRTVLVAGLVATILPNPLHLRTEKTQVLDRCLLNHVVLVWYAKQNVGN
jgi:hypothetical protein